MPGSKILPKLLWPLALLLAGSILSQLPMRGITQVLSTLSIWQWLMWLGLNVLIIGLFTLRWWRLAQMLNLPVNFTALLKIRQAGQAVSFITPGPQFGGEPLQVSWLNKKCGLPLPSAMLALGLDRYYELWVNFGMLLLAGILLWLSPVAAVDPRLDMLLIAGGMLLLVSVTGWAAVKRPQQVLAGLKRLLGRWRQHPRVEAFKTHWQRINDDIQQLIHEQKSGLIQAFVLSLCGWAGLTGELWLLLNFVDLKLSLSAFLVIFLAMRLALLLPLPGGIGTLEASLFWAFQSLDLPGTAVMGVIALMRLRDALILMVNLWLLRME